jgi:hypothetical protein
MAKTPSLLSMVTPFSFSDVVLNRGSCPPLQTIVNGPVESYCNGPTRSIYIPTGSPPILAIPPTILLSSPSPLGASDAPPSHGDRSEWPHRRIAGERRRRKEGWHRGIERWRREEWLHRGIKSRRRRWKDENHVWFEDRWMVASLCDE